MKWIIGVITLAGVLSGIYSLFRTNKLSGISQIALAAVCPLIMISFLSLKKNHAFGGTDWEFLFHSATIDGIPLVWIIFILFILEIILIGRTIFIIAKRHR